MAILGGVASLALVGRKIACPTSGAYVGIVMMVGSSTREEGEAAARQLGLFVAARLLTLPA